MKKEPIHYPWVWVGLVFVVLFSVPWYFPKGSIALIIFGFPLWAWMAILMAFVMSAYLSFMLHKLWNVDEEEEE